MKTNNRNWIHSVTVVSFASLSACTPNDQGSLNDAMVDAGTMDASAACDANGPRCSNDASQSDTTPSPDASTDTSVALDAADAADADMSNPESAELRVLLEIEHQRSVNDPRLAQSLQSESETILARAARVVGQLRDAALFPRVRELASHPSVLVRRAVAEALEWLPAEEARAVAMTRLAAETDDSVRAMLFGSLGRLSNATTLEVVVSELQNLSTPTSSASLQQALYALGTTFDYNPALVANIPAGVSGLPGLGERLWELAQSSDRRVATMAAYPLSRLISGATSAIRNSELPNTIRSSLNRVTIPDARVYLATRLILQQELNASNQPIASAISPEHEALLLAIAEDDPSIPVRIAVLSNLPRTTMSPAKRAVLLRSVSNTNGSIAAVAAYAILRRVWAGGTEFAGDFAALSAIRHSTVNGWARARLGRLLFNLDATQGRLVLNEMLEASVAEKREALAALSDIDSLDTDVPLYFRMAQDTNPAVRATAISSLQYYSHPQLSADQKQQIVDWLGSDDKSLVQGALVAAWAFNAAPGTENDWVPGLAALHDNYDRVRALDFGLAYNAIVGFGALGHMPALETVTAALNDASVVMANAAARSYQQLTTNPAPSRTIVSRPEEAPPTAAEILRASQSDIEFTTEAGVFRMRLNDRAPASSARYLRVVESGHYSNTPVFRASPDSVMQFGDPIGTGVTGANGWMPSEYFGDADFDPATVGVASLGWDQGMSQLFVNYTFNAHFGHAYTPIGRIVQGIDVAHQLTVGATIVSARVVPRN